MALLNYTIIHHEIRKTLGLSMNDYAIADLIYHLSNNPKSLIPGWCYASRGALAEILDLNEKSIRRGIQSLEEKGLVIKDPVTKHVQTTSKWYNDVILTQADKMSDPRTKSPLEADKKSVGVADKMSDNNNILENDIKNFSSKKNMGNTTEDAFSENSRPAPYSKNYKDNPKITRIYDCWVGTPGLVQHKQLTDKLGGAINARYTDGYTPEELEQAISNYALIKNSEDYFFNYSWTLDEFLQRGLGKFQDLDMAKKSYGIKKRGGGMKVYVEQ